MTLKEISNRYRDLFRKTGKIEHYMMYRNTRKLASDVKKAEQTEIAEDGISV